MSTTIVDTSAILAIFDEGYPEHHAIAEIITTGSELLVVSPFVVAEADYMLHARLGAVAARRFAGDIVAGAYELAEWAADDHAAAVDVADTGAGTEDYVGIADASNVVLADRYRTCRILTLDQRHFRSLRPLWGAPYFTVLPYDR